MFPQGSLLEEMSPALQRRSVDIPKMNRHAAVVVAEPGRVTPLAQHFFDVAQEWLIIHAE